MFVWPGPQGDPAFAGGWDLLEDGAKAVERGEEILEEFQYRFAGRGKIISLPVSRAWQAEEEAAIPVLADPGLPALSQAQAAVLAALTDTPQAVAQLEEAAGLPAGQLLGALTELELLGPGPVPPGEAVQPAAFPRRRVFPLRPKGPCPCSGRGQPCRKGAGKRAGGLDGHAPNRGPAGGSHRPARGGSFWAPLTELELLGQAQSHQGKRYSRRSPALAGRQAPSARSSRSLPRGRAYPPDRGAGGGADLPDQSAPAPGPAGKRPRACPRGRCWRPYRCWKGWAWRGPARAGDTAGPKGTEAAGFIENLFDNHAQAEYCRMDPPPGESSPEWPGGRKRSQPANGKTGELWSRLPRRRPFKNIWATSTK